MSYDLTDKVVLVTGASSGIGRATAVEFHRASARVVAAARSMEKLQELQDELGPERLLPVRLDVTVANDREAALAAARERFGPIDVLVNNAGWACFSSVLRLPDEHLERMLGLNFTAPVKMIQAVLPDMLGRRSGQIINISSVVGNQAIPRMTVYSATKAALSSLSTGLRMELAGTGVDVILVSPGSTNTPFFESAQSVDVKTVRLAKTQYSPERVARAVVRSSRRRKSEVTLTMDGWTITVMRRFSHRLADGIMRRFAKFTMPEAKETA